MDCIWGWVMTSQTCSNVHAASFREQLITVQLCQFRSAKDFPPGHEKQGYHAWCCLYPPSSIINCLERLGCICIMDAADLSFQYISFMTVLQSLLDGDPENVSLRITQMSFHLFCSLLMRMRTNPLKDFASSGTWHSLWTLSRARH